MEYVIREGAIPGRWDVVIGGRVKFMGETMAAAVEFVEAYDRVASAHRMMMGHPELPWEGRDGNS